MARATRKLTAHVAIFDEHGGLVAQEIRPVDDEQKLDGDFGKLISAGFVDARDAGEDKPKSATANAGPNG